MYSAYKLNKQGSQLGEVICRCEAEIKKKKKKRATSDIFHPWVGPEMAQNIPFPSSFFPVHSAKCAYLIQT